MKSSIIIKVCAVFCTLFLANCSANGPTKVVIVTDYGDIVLVLYDQTPQHRDNFIKLAQEGFYDGTLFHRVMKEFMIQGGDPESKNAQPGVQLGKGGPGYTVPAEFVPEYIHKRGALAAARLPDMINPAKESSGSQFYIVQGHVFSDYELDRVEEQFAEGRARQMYSQYLQEEEVAMQNAGEPVYADSVQVRAGRRASAYLLENPFRMKAEDRETYKTIGGSPHLDGDYTVFGEVVKGMEVIDKIAELETDNASRPKVDVVIKKMKVTR